MNDEVYNFTRFTRGVMVVVNLCHNPPLEPPNTSDVLVLENLAEFLNFEYIYYIPSDVGGKAAKEKRIEKCLQGVDRDDSSSCIMLVLLANSENATSRPLRFFDNSDDGLDVGIQFLARPLLSRAFSDIESNIPKIVIVYAPEKIRTQVGATTREIYENDNDDDDDEDDNDDDNDEEVDIIAEEGDFFLCVSRPTYYTASISKEDKTSHFLHCLSRIIKENPTDQLYDQIIKLRRETREHSEARRRAQKIEFRDADLHTDNSLTRRLYLVERQENWTIEKFTN